MKIGGYLILFMEYVDIKFIYIIYIICIFYILYNMDIYEIDMCVKYIFKKICIL